MRKKLLLISILLIAVFTCSVSTKTVYGREDNTIGTPKITVKINKKGTGIKLTISKTKNAKMYVVIIRDVVVDKKNNKVTKNKRMLTSGMAAEKDKKTSMSIKGLKGGTYEIQVEAYPTFSIEYGGKKTSDWKSFTLEETETKIGYKTKYDFSKIKKGDVIKFGSYEQDANFQNGKEPIEWIVLSKNNKELFVVSKYILTFKEYEEDRYVGSYPPDEVGYVYWADCTLRNWLNNEFLEECFNSVEKKYIKLSKITASDSMIKNEWGFRIDGGEDTKDYIFLLSPYDVTNTEYGFKNDYKSTDKKRLATCTQYARYGDYGYIDQGYNVQDNNYDWILRAPGPSVEYVHIEAVSEWGDIDEKYYSGWAGGIRPAMIIKY